MFYVEFGDVTMSVSVCTISLMPHSGVVSLVDVWLQATPTIDGPVLVQEEGRVVNEAHTYTCTQTFNISL